jgi:sulfur transfer complex TusBCD TusB component (DsrH family)
MSDDKHYVLIESRDPFDSADTAFVSDTAEALRARGRAVTVYLVQNGVFAGRAGARGSQVPRLAQAGVTVLADDFSLRERGIEAGEIAGGVREASIDALVDLVMRPETKTLWH